MSDISRREYRRLRKFIRISNGGGKILIAAVGDYDVLHKKGYIVPVFADKVDATGGTVLIGYEPTDDGRAYVERRRAEYIKFLIPYITTFILSIIALIVSIIALSQPAASHRPPQPPPQAATHP